jgi:hypothetical protein
VFQNIAIKRAAARTYVLTEWHSRLSRFLRLSCFLRPGRFWERCQKRPASGAAKQGLGPHGLWRHGRRAAVDPHGQDPGEEERPRAPRDCCIQIFA